MGLIIFLIANYSTAYFKLWKGTYLLKSFPKVSVTQLPKGFLVPQFGLDAAMCHPSQFDCSILTLVFYFLLAAVLLLLAAIALALLFNLVWQVVFQRAEPNQDPAASPSHVFNV